MGTPNNSSFNTVNPPSHASATLIEKDSWGQDGMLKHRDAPHSLADKLLGDIVIGCSVTLCVAPFLTIVDKAIVQKAAGSHSMVTSGMETMSLIAKNPLKFAKSPTFLWMWAVYAATYSTANSLKTITEHHQQQQEHEQMHVRHQTRGQQHQEPRINNSATSLVAQHAGMITFFGTSLANTFGSLLKDRAYARMFGTNTVGKSFPKISYGLWMTRDFLVVGSSFVLPDMATKYICDHQEQNNDSTMDRASVQKLAQVSLPVAMQLVAGPLQLLGLDFYNRPLQGMSTRAAILERGHFVAKGFTSIVSARIARIAPGYSIGGVLNTHYREAWRDQLSYQRRQQQRHQGVSSGVSIIAETPRAMFAVMQKRFASRAATMHTVLSSPSPAAAALL